MCTMMVSDTIISFGNRLYYIRVSRLDPVFAATAYRAIIFCQARIAFNVNE